MRPEIVEVDRRSAIRSAARGWERAKQIGPETRAAIDAHTADGWRRTGPWFRLLFAFFTFVAVQGFAGFWGVLLHFDETVGAVLLTLFGGVLAVALELFQGGAKLRRAGVDDAVGWMAFGAIYGGALWLYVETVDRDATHLVAVLGGLAIVLGAAVAWRWGMPPFAAIAAGGALTVLTQLPAARWSWIALGLALHAPLVAASGRAKVPRALRAACAWAWVVLAAAVFAAVFVPSWDFGWLEMLSGRWPESGERVHGPMRLFFVAASLAWPAWLLVDGARRRRSLLLRTGAVLAAFAVGERIVALDLHPRWIPVLGGGLVLLAGALAARRWLAAGPAGERGGVTADPPYVGGDAAAIAETVAGLASFTPAPRAVAAGGEGYAGGGGEFGGGGASGTY